MKLLMTFALIVLVSCKGGGGGSAGSSNSTLSSSEGIWSACENYDGDSDGTNDSSVLHRLIIGDGSFNIERTNHSAVNCIRGSEEYAFLNSGIFSRTGNSYTSVILTDIYTSLSSDDVIWNNDNSWCGISNWVINVPRDTLGLDCDGMTNYAGDVATFSASRSGSTLRVDDLNYTLNVSTDLTPRGQTLANGSFVYSDGEYIAYYGTLNNGVYTVYFYDLQGGNYYSETGTYSSQNNVANFTTISTNPGGCVTPGTRNRRFATGSLGLVLEYSEIDQVLIAPKVNYTESQFRNSWLGGGFSLRCF